MRPMSVEEAWDFILRNHSNYHKYLKRFGYSYDMFIPKNDSFRQMFDKETLTQQDIEQYKNVFITRIYEERKLRHLDNIFETQVKPNFEQIVNKYLAPLVPLWNATMPKEFQILCGFGNGAGYWRKSDDLAVVLFRMSRFPDDATKVMDVLFHEFVHMLIEEPIIEKYNVPQDLKERIVDLICYEALKTPVQKMFEKSFANAYITPEVIKTDLPGAVAKMMTDYTALKQKQGKEY